MLRKAKVGDAKYIYELINEYAKENLLLPRSLSSIYETIRDFWVWEEEGKVIGCGALHVVWEDLAEIKSLAIDKEFWGKGIGGKIIEACIEEAKSLGIKKIFALTYIREYFERYGFEEIPKEILPHKVWGECMSCVKFPNCDEIAVLLDLSKEVEDDGISYRSSSGRDKGSRDY